MKIVSADITSFAGTSDVVLTDLDAPVVCVAGSNEAGKSTLRSFLVSMLFGFPSKSVLRKTFNPDSGRDIEGRLKFRGGDGTEYVVSRRAGSSNNGSIESGDGLFNKVVDLGNDPVPVAELVSKAIFESVHSLTLSEMVGLDAKSIGDVREALLGSMNVEYVRPVHDVIAELEKEASTYWRNDNRGKPASTRIESDISQVRARLVSVRSDELEIESVQTALPLLEAELSASKNQVSRYESLLEELHRLEPLSDGLLRLEALRHKAKVVDGFDDLPDGTIDLLVRLRDAHARTSQQLRQAEDRVAALTRVVDAFDGRMRLLIERSEIVRELAGELSELKRIVADAKVCNDELENVEHNYEGLRTTLFLPTSETNIEWTSGHHERLKMLKANRDLVQRQIDVAEEKAETFETLGRDVPRLIGVGLALQVPAILMGLIWISGRMSLVASIAPAVVVATVLGVVTLVVGLMRRKRVHVALADLEVDRIRQSGLDADASMSSALSHMSLRATVDEVSDGLFGQLDRFARLAVDRQSLLSKREQIQIQRDQFLARARSSGLFSEEDLENPLQTIALVGKELRQAEECLVRSRAAGEDLVDSQARCAELVTERSEFGAQIDAYEDRLGVLGGGSVDVGLKLLASGRKARRDALVVSTGLEERFSRADSERLGELCGDDGDIRNSLDRCRAELKKASSTVSLQTEKRAGLKARLDQLGQGPRAVDIQLELDDLIAERQLVKNQRDRLILLRNIVALANKRFRESHEPNVLSSASRYLSAATLGRWVGLRIPVAGELDVVDARRRTTNVGPALSRGTLDQIFLSLRLGIIDHIDRATERLPVFLDEILVNWDSDRRRNVYPLLKKLSEDRQVFFFTCHEWMREELAVELGAHVVDLSVKTAAVAARVDSVVPSGSGA